MREIKFRAWDRDAEVMWEDAGILPEDTPYEVSMIKETGKPIFKPSTKSVVLMQYTGLKDKNGKEIWEGDVVSRSRSKEYRKYLIEYGRFDGGMGREFDYIGLGIPYPLKDKNEKEYEVIGNIYSNPELLKGGI